MDSAIAPDRHSASAEHIDSSSVLPSRRRASPQLTLTAQYRPSDPPTRPILHVALPDAVVTGRVAVLVESSYTIIRGWCRAALLSLRRV